MLGAYSIFDWACVYDDEKEKAGKEIGSYHFRTSIGAAVATIIMGYLVEFLAIGSIFYIASLLYAWSGFLYFKKA